ncbi:MAG: GTP 3',8-cyclase MoaA [Candidatus Cloacimonadota bacterium]|nr:GTP 3',8-cyclase MoaA [Candidatus Cloacimonadota bacterium]
MEKFIKVDYLRISITDHCNLNCIYCNPLQKNKFLQRKEILSYEEILRIVKIFEKLGISKIRLTGGEPTIRPDLCSFISQLSKTNINEISMTTNGVELYKLSKKLKNSGLDRLNISLDSLDRKKYEEIAGEDKFDQVWSGIMKSLEVGFTPLKINVVLIKGKNDDEILDFARLTLDYPLHIRFIELFKTNNRLEEQQSKSMKSEEAKKIIEDVYGKLSSTKQVIGNGPSQNFQLKNSKGSIGFISNLSENFCGNCNRLRMDSSGKIAPCLFSGYLYDLKPLLRGNYSDKKIKNFMREIIENKSNYNKYKNSNFEFVEMSSIGG